MSERLDRIELILEQNLLKGSSTDAPMHTVIDNNPIQKTINNQLTWINMLGFVATLLIMFVYNDYQDTKTTTINNGTSLATIATDVKILLSKEAAKENINKEILNFLKGMQEVQTAHDKRLTQIETTRFDSAKAETWSEAMKQYFKRDIDDVTSSLNELKLNFNGLKTSVDDLKFMRRDVEENTSTLKERNKIVNTVEDLKSRLTIIEGKI